MLQRHDAALAVAGIVLPLKRDLGIADVDQAMIRDRDAVRVASKVMEYVVWPAERLFRVHDPVVTEQRSQESRERFRLCQRFAASEKDELSSAKEAAQSRDKLAPKDPAQYFHWQEEVIGRANPVLMIRRQSTSGHDAMNMGMRLQSLAPCMEDAQKSDLRAHVFRVGGNLEKRFGTGLEQQREEHFLVLPDERNKAVRHAEHQVIVVHWQQFLLPGG